MATALDLVLVVSILVVVSLIIRLVVVVGIITPGLVSHPFCPIAVC
jgi:hypothetical protein